MRFINSFSLPFYGYNLHYNCIIFKHSFNNIDGEKRKKFHKKPSETLVVGDRLYTDIASGVNAGVDTVCVLCGEVTLADIDKAEGNQVPTFVFAHTREIVE